MKLPIRVILFDLGNTLIYDDPASWKDVFQRADDALWASLHKFDIGSSPAELYGRHETLLHYYYELREGDLDEPGISTVLRALLDEHKITISEAKLQSALRSMYAVTQTNWQAEGDALQVVRALWESDFRLGIISNGAEDMNTFELIDKAGLRSYFEFILSSAAYGKRKPHPGIFQAALHHFRIPPEQSIMIGDNYEADILGAHRLGINTVWVKRRVPVLEQTPLIQPDAIVSTLSEIPSLLSTHRSD
jgi:putative hydrolase of the HAD superfamily